MMELTEKDIGYTVTFKWLGDCNGQSRDRIWYLQKPNEKCIEFEGNDS